MVYDLEYAHVLGDELDTAELRSINSLWRAPTEVSLIHPERPGSAGGAPQPRWRRSAQGGGALEAARRAAAGHPQPAGRRLEAGGRAHV